MLRPTQGGSAPSADGSTPRKHPARATRVSLFDREVRERLSGPAIELLLDRAHLLSEGGRANALPRPDGSRSRDPFFGSTMLTIDLGDLADAVREPLDAAAAERVALLLRGDGRAARQVRRIAEEEACRIAGGHVETAAVEVRVRAVGTTVHIDVDLEGLLPARTLARPAGAS